MDVQVLRPAQLTAAHLARWHAFQAADDLLANPFLSPEFALAVGRVRPAARVAVLRDAGEVAGFFAFERGRLGIAAPLGAGLSDWQGVVHRPGWTFDARELLAGCRLSAWRFDALVASQAPFARHQHRVHDSWGLDLRDGYAAYEASRRATSSNLVSQIARKARKLEREVGPVRTRAGADPADLRTLLAWKSAQYARTGAVDVLRDGSVAALLADLLARRDPWCEIVLHTLHAGDRLVAIDLVLRAPRVATHWFPAYDVELATYSPGNHLLLRTAEAEAARGTAWLDLGRGHEAYKPRFATASLPVADGAVERPGLGGAVSAAGGLPRRVFRRWVAGTPAGPVARRAAVRARARYVALRHPSRPPAPRPGSAEARASPAPPQGRYRIVRRTANASAYSTPISLPRTEARAVTDSRLRMCGLGRSWVG